MPYVFRGPTAKRNKFIAGGAVIIILVAACTLAYVAMPKHDEPVVIGREITKPTQKTVSTTPTLGPAKENHNSHKTDLAIPMKPKNVTDVMVKDFQKEHEATTHEEIGITGKATSTTWSTTPIAGRTTTYTTTPIPGKSGTRRYN